MICIWLKNEWFLFTPVLPQLFLGWHTQIHLRLAAKYETSKSMEERLTLEWTLTRVGKRRSQILAKDRQHSPNGIVWRYRFCNRLILRKSFSGLRGFDPFLSQKMIECLFRDGNDRVVSWFQIHLKYFRYRGIKIRFLSSQE